MMYPLEKGPIYDINETRWSQISLFIIEYALARYLEHLGVQADAYIGHSIGEYVAAALAGVFSLEDAIQLVIARGKLMQSMQPGSMLAVNASEEALKTIVTEYNCEIAVLNSPDDTVVSGDDKAISALRETLESQGMATITLNTSHAYHSQMMEQAATELLSAFKNIQLNKPTKDFVSNITGEIAGEEVATAEYWCKQLRNTVQFAKGVQSLSKLYNHQVTFIEVGTGKGLSSFVNKYKSNKGYKSIHTVQLLPSAKEANANEDRKDFIATLWINGIISKPNDNNLFVQAKLQTELPVYQFNYQTCWIAMREIQDTKTFNSTDEMFYERSWERVDLNTSPGDVENLRDKNILVLVNDTNTGQTRINELLDVLSVCCDNLNYVIHGRANNIQSNYIFNFGDAIDIKTIFYEKNRINPIDIVIYISPGIDITNPGLDILAVKNIFNWQRIRVIKFHVFISISFDNYEVTGNERLQEKPSVVYGVTKSIPFEYFTSGTKAFHIDLSSDTNHIDVLLATCAQYRRERLNGNKR